MTNLHDIDGSVTTDEVDLALATGVVPAPYIDTVETQDTAEFTLPPAAVVVPRTRHQALLVDRQLRVAQTNFGGGQCWHVQRGPIWGLPSLWPTAEIGAQHGAPIHHVTNLDDIPRSVAIGFLNGGLGHVVHGLGGGLCSTTDYHVTGRLGVATIANVASWCSATDVFWFETMNGYDIYPDPKKPTPPPPDHWTRQQKVDFLTGEIANAKKNGNTLRVKMLEAWRRQIIAHIGKD